MIHRALLFTVSLGVAALLLGARTSLAEPGFYSVAEIDGVWWFIDPDGEPFYSLGIDDTRPGPAKDEYDRQRPAYAAFRYYDSTENWAAHTLQRLNDWNFNSIGAWADPALMRGPLPYVVAVHFGGDDSVPWNDLFNDRFESEIDRVAQRVVAPRRGDRNLLGWFSDNELKWYPDSIFQYHVAKEGSATRARQIELLNEHYRGDFAALARDFVVEQAANFQELARSGRLKLRPDGNGRTVILRFTSEIAERYYRVVHDAIRRHDPNHLILGDRYPWHCPDVVARAAAPYVDVISTNFDWPEAKDGYLPSGYLRNLHRITGRPILVTEYYVAADENRSGNKNTGGIFLTVGTQAERADAFENRLRILAGQPYVVGAHWFRFADEPPHGRPEDGEDYNFGLVDIANRPYDVLTAAMTRLHLEVPELHRESAAANAVSTDAIAIPRVRAEASALHTQLVNAQSLSPLDDTLRLYDLLAAWTPDKLYLALLACHVSERDGYSTDMPLEQHQLEFCIATPALKEPVRVGFGGDGGASCNLAEVECCLAAKGLRYTLVAALPAAMLKSSTLEADDQFAFTLSLYDVLDGQKATCEKRLVLAPSRQPTSRRPETSEASSGQPARSTTLTD